MPKDASKVFVIFGRNVAAFRAMTAFLQSLRLTPVDFMEARREMSGTPYIGDVIKECFEQAQCFVVLLTPDERCGLLPNLLKTTDEPSESRRLQPRPNVLLEAGMALGIAARYTILTTLGRVELPSDLDGRHPIRLSNDGVARQRMLDALLSARCDVQTTGRWLDPTLAGDFDSAMKDAADPFLTERLKILKTLFTKQVNHHIFYNNKPHYNFDYRSPVITRLLFREAVSDLLREGLVYESGDEWRTNGVALTHSGWEYCRQNYDQLGSADYFPDKPVEAEKLQVALYGPIGQGSASSGSGQ